jgi:filamentous hemagglutinin family protein
MISLLKIKFTLFISLIWIATAWADNNHPHGIIVDGTIGAKEMKTLQGPEYHIDSELGGIKGNNLFHSFKTFNVHNNEQAIFYGPDTIQNVISRVTGSEYSWIDGTIQSMIPDADFFFFNPNGVAFGPNAHLDLQGSFHVSTCDYMGFIDQTTYDASTDHPLLTTSSPYLFGFIDNDFGQISIQGKGKVMPISDNSLLPSLHVKNGQILSLISGNIVLDEGTVDSTTDFPAGTLVSDNGQINIASVASTGEVYLQFDGVDVSTFEKLGDITLSDYSVISASSGQVDVYGNHLKMNTSYINAGQYVKDGDTVEGFAGGRIDIHVKRLSLLDGSGIFIETFSSENSGDIAIFADIVELQGRYDDIASSISTSSINLDLIDNLDPNNTSDIDLAGNAGNIHIYTERLFLADGANIEANAFSQGLGGRIYIDATDTIDLRGDFINMKDQPTGIYSVSASQGNSGIIFLKAGKGVSLQDCSMIGGQSFGMGYPGGIIIDTPELSLDNESIVSATSFNEENSLDGLGIVIGRDIVFNEEEQGVEVNQMSDLICIKNHSEISTESYGKGRAGIVHLVSKNIELDEHALLSSSSVKRGDSGHSGEIYLISENLLLDHESIITTENAGMGDAGMIRIETSDLSLDNFSIINSVNTYGKDGGTSGIIMICNGIEAILPDEQTNILPSQSININNHSGLSTSTLSEGSAGAIIMRAKDLIMTNSAFISSENKYPKYSDEVGIISIRSENMRLSNESKISTQSESETDAGGIAIETSTLYLSNQSYISSAGIDPDRNGAAGKIIIAKKISYIDDALFGFIEVNDIMEEKDILQVREPVNTIQITDFSSISTSSAGPGDAGGIHIGSKHLYLSGGSDISSESTSKTGGGSAGFIKISHLDNLQLIKNSKISTQAINTSVPDTIIPGIFEQDRLNGVISISSSHGIHLFSGRISSSVLGGLGNGGNISIYSKNIIMNRSQIIANAYEGNGGNIYIGADYLIQSSDSGISASSHLGIDGDIIIDAFTENFDKQIVVLPDDFLEATQWIQTPCHLRDYEKDSHFFITLQKVRPDPFYDWHSAY